MPIKPIKNQILSAKTKGKINEALASKNKEHLKVNAVQPGDVVYYHALDGSRPIYRVLDATKDNYGIYNIQVQKIDNDGSPGNQKFYTTLDKISRLWLQPGDKIIYTSNGRGLADNFIGIIETIYNDSGSGEILVKTREQDSLKERAFMELHFTDMHLYVEEA